MNWQLIRYCFTLSIPSRIISTLIRHLISTFPFLAKLRLLLLSAENVAYRIPNCCALDLSLRSHLLRKMKRSQSFTCQCHPRAVAFTAEAGTKFPILFEARPVLLAANNRIWPIFHIEPIPCDSSKYNVSPRHTQSPSSLAKSLQLGHIGQSAVTAPIRCSPGVLSVGCSAPRPAVCVISIAPRYS